MRTCSAGRAVAYGAAFVVPRGAALSVAVGIAVLLGACEGEVIGPDQGEVLLLVQVGPNGLPTNLEGRALPDGAGACHDRVLSGWLALDSGAYEARVEVKRSCVSDRGLSEVSHTVVETGSYDESGATITFAPDVPVLELSRGERSGPSLRATALVSGRARPLLFRRRGT